MLGNALADMYIKCGALENAQWVFAELPVEDVLWTPLIAGYTQQGQGHDASNCFEQMQCKGFSLDPATLACVLNACNHSGQDEGLMSLANCQAWSAQLHTALQAAKFMHNVGPSLHSNAHQAAANKCVHTCHTKHHRLLILQATSLALFFVYFKVLQVFIHTRGHSHRISISFNCNLFLHCISSLDYLKLVCKKTFQISSSKKAPLHMAKFMNMFTYMEKRHGEGKRNQNSTRRTRAIRELKWPKKEQQGEKDSRTIAKEEAASVEQGLDPTKE